MERHGRERARVNERVNVYASNPEPDAVPA
jgi:hypothetical protein